MREGMEANPGLSEGPTRALHCLCLGDLTFWVLVHVNIGETRACVLHEASFCSCTSISTYLRPYDFLCIVPRTSAVEELQHLFSPVEAPHCNCLIAWRNDVPAAGIRKPLPLGGADPNRKSKKAFDPYFDTKKENRPLSRCCGAFRPPAIVSMLRCTFEGPRIWRDDPPHSPLRLLFCWTRWTSFFAIFPPPTMFSKPWMGSVRCGH